MANTSNYKRFLLASKKAKSAAMVDTQVLKTKTEFASMLLGLNSDKISLVTTAFSLLSDNPALIGDSSIRGIMSDISSLEDTIETTASFYKVLFGEEYDLPEVDSLEDQFVAFIGALPDPSAPESTD